MPNTNMFSPKVYTLEQFRARLDLTPSSAFFFQLNMFHEFLMQTFTGSSFTIPAPKRICSENLAILAVGRTAGVPIVHGHDAPYFTTLRALVFIQKSRNELGAPCGTRQHGWVRLL